MIDLNMSSDFGYNFIKNIAFCELIRGNSFSDGIYENYFLCIPIYTLSIMSNYNIILSNYNI